MLNEHPLTVAPEAAPAARTANPMSGANSGRIFRATLIALNPTPSFTHRAGTQQGVTCPGRLAVVASWAEFENEEPSLAAAASAAFAAGKHCTMATIRADGGPRISGTEVEFVDGAVYLGMPEDSRKALDLLRDPRVAVHSQGRDPAPDGSWVGEAKFSGRAVPVPVPPHYPPGALRMRIDLSSVVHLQLNDQRTAMVIRLWRPERGTQTMVRN